MRRHDITDYADFVRGIATPEVEENIRRELASSTRSRRRIELLRRVAEVGRRDHDHPVPDSAVRIARAIGSLRPPAGATSSFRRLSFQILFDNLAQPALAGTRSGATEARHVVVEADEFTVDARFEPSRRTPSGRRRGSYVTAQILRRDDGQPIPDTPVLVFSGDSAIDSGSTNPTGDFQAGDLPDGPLSLCLLVREEACIELPLSPA